MFSLQECVIMQYAREQKYFQFLCSSNDFQVRTRKPENSDNKMTVAFEAKICETDDKDTTLLKLTSSHLSHVLDPLSIQFGPRFDVLLNAYSDSKIKIHSFGLLAGLTQRVKESLCGAVVCFPLYSRLPMPASLDVFYEDSRQSLHISREDNVHQFRAIFHRNGISIGAMTTIEKEKDTKYAVVAEVKHDDMSLKGYFQYRTQKTFLCATKGMISASVSTKITDLSEADIGLGLHFGCV